MLSKKEKLITVGRIVLLRLTLPLWYFLISWLGENPIVRENYFTRGGLHSSQWQKSNVHSGFRCLEVSWAKMCKSFVWKGKKKNRQWQTQFGALWADKLEVDNSYYILYGYASGMRGAKFNFPVTFINFGLKVADFRYFGRVRAETARAQGRANTNRWSEPVACKGAP